jgi:hypothetical protein
VLLPRTASRSASALYVLKNGELLNLGRLKTTKEDVDLRAEGAAGAAVVRRLAKGTHLRVRGEPGAKEAFVKVADFSDLPTFTPPPADAPPAPVAEAAPAEPPSIGFV